MKGLKGTKTAENLMKSFAGESQVRARYNLYSSMAKKEGYVQISNIFMEIAEQEKEHAKRFYEFLKNDFEDEAIEITTAYTVALHEDTLSNLKKAAIGEKEEWIDLYLDFASIARVEGFEEIAVTFEEISEVERRHGARYSKLAKNIKENTVFKKHKPVLWKCLNCGYIYEGSEAPVSCPACAHPQGYFEVFIENY